MDKTHENEVEAILEFWFGDLEGRADVDASKSALWWKGAPKDDEEILNRFGAAVQRALSGELDRWADEPRGALALVILLDQFTRSIGRGTPEAFAGDGAALAASLRAVERGQDQELRLIERSFLYMPLMHAEDPEIAERSVVTYTRLSGAIAAAGIDGFPDPRSHAVQHADIVRRFGRYPHRNAILEREPTGEEQAFLSGGGPTFGQEKR